MMGRKFIFVARRTASLMRRSSCYFCLRWLIAIAVLFSATSAIAQATFRIAAFERNVASEVACRVFQELLGQLGVNSVIDRFPIARVPIEMEAGRVDGECLRPIDYVRKHNPDLFLVEPPVFTWPWAIYYKKDTGLQLKSFDDLKGIDVGHARGYMVIGEMLASVGVKAKVTGSSHQLIKMLEAGRFDAIVDSSYDIDYLIRKENISGVVSSPLPGLPMHLVLSRENKTLQANLSTLIARHSKSGALKNMYNKAFKDIVAAGAVNHE